MNWPAVDSIDAAPAASLGEPVLDGRTVGGTEGRLAVFCGSEFREAFGDVAIRERPGSASSRERSRSVSFRSRPDGETALEREIAASGADGALVVASTGESVADVVSGPTVGGTPVGVVRADSAAALRPFLDAVGRPSVSSCAVLAMGTDAYLAAGGRLVDAAGGDVVDCRADRCSRPEACRVLARGPALAVYAGHGWPPGWSGYQALRWEHVREVPQRRPIGAVVHLSCATMSGDRPFAARFVERGRACASLGCVGSLPADAVGDLAAAIGDALGEVRTVGELLRAVRRGLDDPGVLESFRLVGSPLRRIG